MGSCGRFGNKLRKQFSGSKLDLLNLPDASQYLLIPSVFYH
jgi:hypothetical protein